MQLRNTSKLMNSKNYKERFLAEYFQLKIRIEKLEEFLVKYKNNELEFTPDCSYDLLDTQLYIMKNYLEVLTERAKIENISLEEPNVRVEKEIMG